MDDNFYPFGVPGTNSFARIGPHQDQSWHLAPFFNVRAWACDNTPATEKAEVGTMCELQCQYGYEPVQGITRCFSLGGGGVLWSHLNGGIKDSVSLLEPACCIASPAADHLTITSSGNTTVSINSINATELSATFSWPPGFSRSCRTGGKLKHAVETILGMIIQICSSTDEVVCRTDGNEAVEQVLALLPTAPESSGSSNSSDSKTKSPFPPPTSVSFIQISQAYVYEQIQFGTTISKFVEIDFPPLVGTDQMNEKMMQAGYSFNKLVAGGSLLYSSTYNPHMARIVYFGVLDVVAGYWTLIN